MQSVEGELEVHFRLINLLMYRVTQIQGASEPRRILILMGISEHLRDSLERNGTERKGTGRKENVPRMSGATATHDRRKEGGGKAMQKRNSVSGRERRRRWVKDHTVSTRANSHKKSAVKQR